MSTPTPTRPDTTGRARPAWVVPAAAGGLVVLAVVLWLFQPWQLFIDTQVDETLPEVLSAPEPADGATTSDAAEAAPDDEMASTDPDMEEPGGQDTASDPAAGAAEPEPEPTGPVVEARGDFISRDHGTTGTVQIIRLEDGSRVLAIADLATDNGPDLFVYLDDTAADGPEADWDDGVSLGRLRGNVGNLVYEIPDDLDLDGVVSVGIWCDRFSSLFGAADLTPVA